MMLKLKTLISILAAALMAFASAAAGGAFTSFGLVLSAATVAILLAVAQGAGIFGVSVYQFQPPIPAYLSWAGGIMVLVQAGHAQQVQPGAAQSVFWVAFGCLGVVVSNLGKSPLPHPVAVPVDPGILPKI